MKDGIGISENFDQKLVTYNEAREIIQSFDSSEAKIFPELIIDSSSIVLDPSREWYGILVDEDNQKIGLDLDHLLSDAGEFPRMYTFHLVLFTNKGMTVKWDSRLFWSGSEEAPEMDQKKGYVYELQINLTSQSTLPNPLAGYVFDECLPAIRLMYSFPLVHPPVSGVQVTAKYLNDYQEEGGGLIIGEPPTFPPSDDYYKIIPDPEMSLSNPGYRLFLKITVNYIPSNKDVCLIFVDPSGTVLRSVSFSWLQTNSMEMDTSTASLSQNIVAFGYIVTDPSQLIYNNEGWTKLGSF